MGNVLATSDGLHVKQVLVFVILSKIKNYFKLLLLFSYHIRIS
jgi:hypothetical protein